MIAILTHNTEMALRDLNYQRTVSEYSRATCKGLFWSGREFTIVTLPEQLYGLRISDYRIIGSPDPGLVTLARARMM